MATEEWGFILDIDSCSVLKTLDYLFDEIKTGKKTLKRFMCLNKLKEQFTNFYIGKETILYNERQLYKYAEFWNKVLNYNWSMYVFKEFDRYDILGIFFPELTELCDIPQKKKRVTNAFEHTLLVLNEVEKKYPDNIYMKIAALYHDAGKVIWKDTGNFIGHELLSLKILNDKIKVMCFASAIDVVKSMHIIQYHMLPLSYQRNPNWNEFTINNFIEKCSPYEDDIINFAICDKSAHQGIESPLLYELKERVNENKRRNS